MEGFLIRCLDLFITAIAYLIVPTIFCICRKKLTLPKIKIVVIINGICIWLLFAIISINAGQNGTSGAVFLWSAIAYFLMKKFCFKKNDEQIITKTKQKRVTLFFVVIVLSILLVTSMVYNVIQYTIIQKHTEGIKYLEENVLSSYIVDYTVNYDEDDVSFDEWTDSENNSFVDEFLKLRAERLKEEKEKSKRIYNYDPETNKYIDKYGNEYKK